MSAISLVQAIGSSALFSSRMFLPAFLTAAILRWGEQIPLIRSFGLMADTPTAPVWFTSDAALVVLAVLSLAELIGDKIAEVRAFTDEAQAFAKPAIAAATSLGVVSATDAHFASVIVHEAGFALPIVALVAGSGTAAMTWLRRSVVDWIENADPDDTLHVRKMLSWGEDFWIFLGIFVLFVLPALMVVLVLAFAAALTLVRRHLAAREEREKVPCVSCAAPMFRSAPGCPSCKAPASTPADVGQMGQAIDRPCGDLRIHRFKLLSHLRCPQCASRLKLGDVLQACAACGTAPFANRAERAGYVAYLDGKQPKAYAIVAALSLMPVLGYICAAVYVQFNLVAPVRVHLPLGRRWALKWLLRLIRWAVLVLQIIPGVNSLAAVVDSVIQYRAHRRALVALLAELPRGPDGE